jgi:flagellin
MLGGASMSVGTLATKNAGGLNLNAAASNTLTLGTTQPTPATDKVTIGTVAYSFVAAGGSLPASTATTVSVSEGSTVGETLQNLANAVNGTDGNTANTAATAAVNAAGTGITFTSSIAGDGTAAAATGDSAVATSATLSAWTNSDGTTNATGLLTGGKSDANLNSPAEAQSALVAITSAITTVSQSRGNLGAEINQLTAASNVMTSQTTNLQSADNDIMNADIGKTVANMTQYNILQSTGMSALQQANQAQQAVLKLLQ